MTPSIMSPPPAAASRRWHLRRRSLCDSEETTPTTTPKPTEETAKRTRSRSVDMAALHSSLKKAPAGLSAKFAQYMDGRRLKDALRPWAHHRANQHDETATADDKRHHQDPHHRHVHFPTTNEELHQEIERPETTEEEKASYHYTRQELMDMILEAKEAMVKELRFHGQPDGTIFEQGYLTFPNEHHFFHHKRLYCVLKARQLLCYASPAHAARNVHLKCQLSIIRVQDCAAMSMQNKIAMFGAHLPSTISLLFLVTKANGERVLLSAESRQAKKNWVYVLNRLTEVHDLPCQHNVTRQSSTSSAETCTSEDEAENSLSDDEQQRPEVDVEVTPQKTCDKQDIANAGDNNDKDSLRMEEIVTVVP